MLGDDYDSTWNLFCRWKQSKKRSCSQLLTLKLLIPADWRVCWKKQNPLESLSCRGNCLRTCRDPISSSERNNSGRGWQQNTGATVAIKISTSAIIRRESEGGGVARFYFKHFSHLQHSQKNETLLLRTTQLNNLIPLFWRAQLFPWAVTRLNSSLFKICWTHELILFRRPPTPGWFAYQKRPFTEIVFHSRSPNAANGKRSASI